MGTCACWKRLSGYRNIALNHFSSSVATVRLDSLWNSPKQRNIFSISKSACLGVIARTLHPLRMWSIGGGVAFCGVQVG